MNHLPFKEWLISEEPLTREQAQTLGEHLRDCNECNQTQVAWSEVRGLLQQKTQIMPAADFTQRWLDRMEARNARRQRRQLWIALGVGLILALITLVILSVQLSDLFQSPTRFLILWLAQFASLFVVLTSLQEYLVVIFKSMPIIPILGLVLGIGVVSFLGVMWLAACQQLLVARRFVK